jgi:hypothetical protein
MNIRRATEADFESMWPIFRAVVATGTTYVFDPETSREDAFAYWLGPGGCSWVAEEEGRIVGMYKIVPNQRDLGSSEGVPAYWWSRAAHSPSRLPSNSRSPG